jgi:hypothetical protein
VRRCACEALGSASSATRAVNATGTKRLIIPVLAMSLMVLLQTPEVLASIGPIAWEFARLGKGCQEKT